MIEAAVKILEVIKWPAMVGVIGLVALFRFSDEIRAWCRRVKKAGPVELGPTSEQQKQLEPVQTGTVAKPSSGQEDLMRAFDSPVLLGVEADLKQALKEKADADPQRQIDALVRHLAFAQICVEFERINHVLFGSQLALIVHLNSLPQGETPERLKPIYDAAATNFPQTFDGYPYDSYLGFLKAHKLIVEENGRLHVTAFGKDFMMYLVRRGYTGRRPN